MTSNGSKALRKSILCVLQRHLLIKMYRGRYTMMQVSEYNSKLSSLGVQVLSRCLKITEKVSFNIASEASYLYILLKMPKIVYFGEFLKTWSLRSNSVTRQVSFNRTKIGGKCDILSNFQTMCTLWISDATILESSQLNLFLRSLLLLLCITGFGRSGSGCKLRHNSRQSSIFWLQTFIFRLQFLKLLQ